LNVPSIIASRAASRRLLVAISLLSATAIVGCSTYDGMETAGTPVAIRETGGTDISGQIANDLGPYVVSVVDAGGVGVPGVEVTFTISGPATLVTPSATTNQDGSTFTSITLGHMAGAITITATAAGIATPTVFHTSSFAGPATKFGIAGGQGQTALRGTPISEPLSTIVADQYDNPVMNARVVWATSAGVLGTLIGQTGADGRSSSTYTMPATPGPQTVTATTDINAAATTLTFNLTSN